MSCGLLKMVKKVMLILFVLSVSFKASDYEGLLINLQNSVAVDPCFP